MANFRISITAFTIIITLLTTETFAHSNIGSPLAYSPSSCKASTSWCKTPCPKVYKTGKAKARNTMQNPAATWSRGEEVEIIWHKNNHVGGFYRRSLVPVEHMFDHNWHKRTAFDYGCWQQGICDCGKNAKCGGDQKGRAYKNKVTIPDVFPDGNYVFAQVWYGGLHWTSRYPKYSDYFACSFVKIQGGNPLVSSQKATFTGPEMKCSTGSTRPLQCKGESCGDSCGLAKCLRSSVQVTVPDEWKDGAVPKVFLKNIDSDAVPGAVSVSEPEPPLTPAEQKIAAPEDPIPAEEKAMMKEEKKDMMNDVKEGKEEATKPQKSEQNPLVSLRVFVDNEMASELMDGNVATISLHGGKSITFEGYTGGKKVGTMYFEIDGKTEWKERSVPYVFMGNEGTMYNSWRKPIVGKEFQFGLIVWKLGKRYTISTKITLEK